MTVFESGIPTSSTGLSGEARCPRCHSAYDSYRLVQGAFYYYCTECAVYFLWPIPAADVLNRYYEILHHNYGAENRSYADLSARLYKDFDSKRVVLEKRLRHDHRVRILDFGCAHGIFLNSLPPSRYERFGCDMSSDALAVARGLLGDEVKLSSDLDELRSCEGSFDCVTMWATIEHLPNPADVLQHIRKMLKPGGLLCLDTGVAGDALSRAVKGNVQWFDSPQHLWVFTVAGMDRLLTSCGYSVEYCDPAFERTPVRRLLKKVFANGVALSTKLLNRVVSLEDRKIPVGNLGLWIARKR